MSADIFSTIVSTIQQASRIWMKVYMPTAISSKVVKYELLLGTGMVDKSKSFVSGI